ncbi:MAG: ParB N-terminal domain-containing protein [Pirellulaceae bacterium]|nr:ParB N-terminal domain-containing protein [Pirellulaceae bacterium]
MIAKTKSKKLDRYAVKYVSLKDIKPSPENEKVYGEVEHDEAMDHLVDSIRRKGLAEPLLLTADGFILSGHRRYYALRFLRVKEVPVRIDQGVRRKNNCNYLRELTEYNPQRVKSVGTILREALLRDNDVVDTYAAIEERRESELEVEADFMDVDGCKTITPISDRRQEFLEAVKQVIEELREFHPLSIRQIHYRLLNNPPLKQKPKRSKYGANHYRYKNDTSSYNSLIDLLKPARYHGHISMKCIDDPTRPQKSFGGYTSVQQFVHSEVDGFLTGFHRNRQQDQPRHIEVFGEKNTLYKILVHACQPFYVPLNIGRGFCSIPVWRDMASRFRASGKEAMTLIIVSDFDPEGLCLADDAIRSLELQDVPVNGCRVAVTREQIDELGLVQDFNPAKDTSKHYDAFVERTGDTKTWECESLPPNFIVEQVQAAIQANMAMDIYEDICDREELDCEELCGIREQIAEQLAF